MSPRPLARLLFWVATRCSMAVVLLSGPAAHSAVHLGDLDGDGAVAASDEALFVSFYGGSAGEANYDPVADLDSDGVIGLRDLALFSAVFGAHGDVDTSRPSVLVTLNDIPDDMNDILVVPPGGFQITILFDNDGSVLAPETLEVYSIFDLGQIAAFTNIAPMFEVTPTRAMLEIAPDPSITRTTHAFAARVSDKKGNSSAATFFVFAIRDFAIGAPMGSLQTVFLDFDQDRNLGPDIDFIESLREFGLSSASAPEVEVKVRDILVSEIVSRTRAYYGYKANGDPGDDPVDIRFTSELPAVGYSRLCVGGQSPAGSLFLGAAPLDLHNAAKTTDDCGLSPQFGVFPHAIDNLWQNASEYQAAFGPVDPSLGGIAIGEDPFDSKIFGGSMKLGSATSEEIARLWEVANALEAFAQTIATAIAHETGHMLGLSAPGATPAGLYGGSSGATKDHNVTVTGATPSENYLMNAGGSFTFAEISGRGGPLPKFRPLSWAYLHDRVALNSIVKGLYLAPELDAVSPSPLSFGGQTQANFNLSGSNFTETITVKLFSGGPIPLQISSTTVLPGGSEATATINSFLVPPGVYDVQLTNVDGQQTTMVGALQVVP